MSSSHLEFETRVRKLLRKHTAMSRGYTTRMREDGLIVAQPRRQVAPISGRSLFIFLMAFVLFKGFLIASLGPTGYDERVGRLEQGNLMEQAGAFAMQADPIASMVAIKIGSVLR